LNVTGDVSGKDPEWKVFVEV